jgi:hypothetical protein
VVVSGTHHEALKPFGLAVADQLKVGAARHFDVFAAVVAFPEAAAECEPVGGGLVNKDVDESEDAIAEDGLHEADDDHSPAPVSS